MSAPSTSSDARTPLVNFTADEHPATRRPALDGLRAFAVVAVIAFHGGLTRFHGGFLGVDVFFVLSGFLITSVLVSEYDRRRTINFGRFWIRRAKRLLPALCVIIVAVALSALYLTQPDFYQTLTSDILTSFFYVANWHLMAPGTSYFAHAAPPSLLTHTWSLSIEEQFYLLWPLVVFALMRWRHNARVVGWLAVAGALASTVEMAVGQSVGWSTDRLYYGTDTHAQGLLCGAAMAAFLYGAQESGVAMGTLTDRATRVLRYLGPFAIVGAVVLMDRAYGTSTWMFDGGFLAVSILAALTILYVVTMPTTLVGRALSWRPIVYVGQISYGLYLWHYPIFRWVTHANTGLYDFPLFCVRVGLAVLAAVASYHLLEMPIRRSDWPRSSRSLIAGVLAFALVVAGCVVVAERANAVPSLAAPPSSTLPTPPLKVLILGDSMALTLALPLAAWAPSQHMEVEAGAVLGCGIVAFTLVRYHDAIWGPYGRHSPCHANRHGLPNAERVWNAAIAADHPQVVVLLAGRWETHTLFVKGRWRTIFDPLVDASVQRALDEIHTHAAAAHSAFVVETAPCVNDFEQTNGHVWDENDPRRLHRFNSIIRASATRDDYVVQDLYADVCPGGHFASNLGGWNVRSGDGVHFAPQSAAYLGPILLPFWRRVALAYAHAHAHAGH